MYTFAWKRYKINDFMLLALCSCMYLVAFQKIHVKVLFLFSFYLLFCANTRMQLFQTPLAICF